MYFYGSLMKTGAGVGLLFISPLGVHMRYVIEPPNLYKIKYDCPC